MDKTGVQMRGHALQLESDENIKVALALWNRANPGKEDIINLESIKAGKIQSRVFKIKPEIIKFFGYGTGEEKQKIFNF